MHAAIISAKAGIRSKNLHRDGSRTAPAFYILDSRLRGNDGC